MSNTNDIKPWFRVDLRDVLKALYFAMKISSIGKPYEYWRGVLNGLASFGLAVGVMPAEFMSASDAQAVSAEVKR